MRLLVDVVADAGAVSQQMLDVHTVVDQRQIVSQYRARGSGQFEFAALDEGHHGQGGHALGAARDAETRVDAVGDAMAAVRQAVGAGERGASVAVNADNAGKAGRRGDLVDRLRQVVHERSLGVRVTVRWVDREGGGPVALHGCRALQARTWPGL